MPGGKQYEMLFKLNAQANSGFKGTFTQAQAQFAKLGNEIQALNRVQGDIAAYQKQSAAIEGTSQKLSNLKRQHDALQERLAASTRQQELFREQIAKSTGDTSGLEQKLAKATEHTAKLREQEAQLDERVRGANVSLDNQKNRLDATTKRLEEAGVSMDDLSGESARLADKIQELSAQQDTASHAAWVAQKEMEELSRQEEEAAQSAEEYGKSAANAFDAAASALAAAGLVAGLKRIGEAYIGTVQAAGEFGAVMSNVEALSGANTQQMAALNAQAKELGATTKFTALESGEAMGYMGMAGWNAQQMLAGMPDVLDLSAASGEDLAGVADIVTDSLTGFKLTAADTGEFVDVLAEASRKSNTNVSMLGESFKYVAPLAGTLGYSAQDTAVALGLMANAGIKSSQAGTTLRTALTNLVSPTKEQAAEMDRLKISLTDSTGLMLPLLDTVDNLRGAFDRMSEAEQSAAASTLFGKEAMSGMLAIINASEADYNNLTQSIYNSAGAAEAMAKIKLDNLSGDLTLLQSAADGLSLTLGEVFMPQVRGLVQAGTNILGVADKVVQDNPALVKALMAGAGAVGLMTAAVTAFAAAKKAAAAIDLAAMFTGPVGPIIAVAGAVAVVTAGIIGAVEEANKGVPKVEELTQAARDSAAAMGEIAGGFADSQADIAATADVAGVYIDRLDELGAKTSLTKAESQEYHNILQLLCDSVPELAASIDLETDSISGGTEALRAQTEAWKENAQEQARQEALKELMAEQGDVLKEQAKNTILLQEAEAKLKVQQKRRAEIMAQQAEMEQEARDNAHNLTDEYFQLSDEMGRVNEDIRISEATIESYNQALVDNQAAANAAKRYVRDFAGALMKVPDAAGEAEEAVSEFSAAERKMAELAKDSADKTVASFVGIGGYLAGTLGEVNNHYHEMYNAAYDSISGQMGLFENMSGAVSEYAEKADLSLENMKNALDSQAQYMNDYAANMQKAVQMGVDDGLLAELSDGSVESAAYLQEIVNSSDEKIKEVNESFKKVEQGKEDFARTIAEARDRHKKIMDEAVQNSRQAIQEMDMRKLAVSVSESTFSGLIAGAMGMKDAVYAAYNSVALSAMSGLSAGVSAGISITRGYASGTENAAPGFALVGERGPELVLFGGGEQVLNARETAALQARPALSAQPAYSYGGEPMTVQIIFQIEGNATPETVDRLRSYGGEFEARVRRVFDDYIRDKARRRI